MLAPIFKFQADQRAQSSHFCSMSTAGPVPPPPMPCPYWLRAHKLLRAARAVPMGSPIQCRSAVPISTIGRVLPSRRVGPRGGFRTQLNTETLPTITNNHRSRGFELERKCRPSELCEMASLPSRDGRLHGAAETSWLTKRSSTPLFTRCFSILPWSILASF